VDQSATIRLRSDGKLSRGKLLTGRSVSHVSNRSNHHPGRQDVRGCKILKEPDIWYVSYRSNITPNHTNEERVVRGTRRFKAEADAKRFAQEIIQQGWSAIAGTINPHQPKKAIPSTKLLDWIAGE
jgi:hypothetical protein